MKLAIVEDNDILREQLKLILEKQNFNVVPFGDGESFLNSYYNNYDIVLLDINLPNMNGIEVFNVLQHSKSKAKIIFLTSYDDIEYMKQAFNLGCEDYITKPYRVEELLLRINRIKKNLQPITNFNSYKFDFDKLKIYRGKEVIEITKKEKKILKLFLANIDKVIPFEELNDKIWNSEALNNTIVASVSRIKKKLNLDNLENIRNVGYILKSD